MESLQWLDSRSTTQSNDKEMICSILQFLDASPGRLLEDLASTPANGLTLFKPFLFCVISPNLAVRSLAVNVANRLFADHGEEFQQFESGQLLGTPEIRRELYSRRYLSILLKNEDATANKQCSSKVILGLCEKIASQGAGSDIATLHDCLEARLLLLKNIPVSIL
jgi:neurofibromin 1